MWKYFSGNDWAAKAETVYLPDNINNNKNDEYETLLN